MRFSLSTAIVAALALAAPVVRAVQLDFYVGADCHGANLGHSNVHELNHRYDCPTNTASMVISDNGNNRNVVVTSGGSGSKRGSGCLTAKCSTFALRA